MFVYQEPPRTGLEIMWRVFGIRFRIQPSFFLFSALIAYFFVGPNLAAIAVDVACILFAILFTELVQGLVYKSYGLRSSVLIQDFGGGIYPEAEPPTAMQRIVVALSAPASSFLLLALVYYSNQEYQWEKVNDFARFAYFILWLISLFWGIIGLLPIFPYPGGRVMLEILNFLTPRNGLVMTLTISVVLGVAYIAYTAAVRLFHAMPEVPIPMVEGVKLPASIILAIFFAISTMKNWQLLQYARAQQPPRSRGDETTITGTTGNRGSDEVFDPR